MLNRLTQALAIGAASAALVGGIALSSADVASAAPSGPTVTARHISQGRCHFIRGHWVRVWHARWRDRRGHWHNGYWTREWRRGRMVCGRR